MLTDNTETSAGFVFVSSQRKDQNQKNMDLQAIKPKSLRSLREKIEKRKKERLLGSCSPKKTKLKQEVTEETEGLFV